jgi:hypothetical protein
MTSPREAVVRAAEDYARRGWSIVPVKADKRPAVRAWKSAQQVAAAPEAIASWFARNRDAVGVGIVLGRVSGGLYCRDFDDAGAYSRWAHAFPEYAKQLPTVRTGRGLHVYSRHKGVTTTTMPDGELRGEGAYVLAPPSPHIAGGLYAWLVPLPNGPLPDHDPEAIGLAWQWIADNTATSDPRATERTERTEKQRHRVSRDTEDTEDTEAIAKGLIARESEAIEAAILRTLPTAHGSRNNAIFRLARALKAIPGLWDARVVLLKPIVKDWHARAAPAMRTKDFGTTWGDFVNAWANVRYAEGEDVLGAALAAAETADPPPGTEDYAPAHRLLASLCRNLQRRAGDAPFFLACGKAGECVGVDKGTASRWLKALQADGALVVTVPHTAHRATRWRWIERSNPSEPDRV